MKHYVLTVNQTEIQFNEGELFRINNKVEEYDLFDYNDYLSATLKYYPRRKRIYSFDDESIWDGKFLSTSKFTWRCIEDDEKNLNDLLEIAKLF